MAGAGWTSSARDDAPGDLIGEMTGELKSNSRASMVGENRTTLIFCTFLTGCPCPLLVSDDTEVGGVGTPFASMVFFHSSKPSILPLLFTSSLSWVGVLLPASSSTVAILSNFSAGTWGTWTSALPLACSSIFSSSSTFLAIACCSFLALSTFAPLLSARRRRVISSLVSPFLFWLS